MEILLVLLIDINIEVIGIDIDIEIDKDKDFNTVEAYFTHVVHLSFFWLSFRSRRVAIFFLLMNVSHSTFIIVMPVYL